MEKIHRSDGFAIIENEGAYQISWPQGPYNEPVFYPITKEVMEKAFKSDQDAYEVKVYAETGQWPSSENEELESKRAFVRNFPELLLQIPDNQKLFTEEELKELLPIAKKTL